MKTNRFYPLADLLACIRSFGYMVGVHNDYRLEGEVRTFWLFTHPGTGTFLKAEGPTDEEVLWDVIRQLPKGYQEKLPDGMRS